MDHHRLSELFGGMFSTISEYPGTVSSPYYQRSVIMLERFLENFNCSVLEKELVDWIGSEFLDKAYELGQRSFAEKFMCPSMFLDRGLFEFACSLGCLELVKLLENKDRLPEDGRLSCFLQACRNGHLKVVEYLIETNEFEEVDYGPSFSEENFAFMDMCRNGYLDILKILPQEILGSFWANTGIASACENGHYDVVKWIVENHKTLHIPDHQTEGWAEHWGEETDPNYKLQSLFLSICRKGNLEIVQWFFKKHPLNIVEMNVLEMVCHNDKTDLADWLDRKFPQRNLEDREEEAFQIACQRGNLVMAKWLFQKYPERVDPNSETRFNFTQICRGGHLEMAQWFVETFSVNTSDGSFFVEICEKGHLELAKWYSEKYAIPNHGVYRAVIDALHNGEYEVVDWLVKKYPNTGYFEILCGCENTRETVKFMLENRKVKDHEFMDGLVHSFGDWETCRLLLSHRPRLVLTRIFQLLMFITVMGSFFCLLHRTGLIKCESERCGILRNREAEMCQISPSLIDLQKEWETSSSNLFESLQNLITFLNSTTSAP